MPFHAVNANSYASLNRGARAGLSQRRVQGFPHRSGLASLGCLLLFALSQSPYEACANPASSITAPPPVLSPAEQAETFQFAEPGYRIELVASEPMVQDPVAISFDGKGRLWVVEMRGFMRDINQRDEKKPDGRISVLEDLDGDGVMDKSTVFADDLVLPRTLLVYPDGVLVGENKALSFLQDLDGDLRYDKKTLVDPKFARNNIEHSSNGLLAALDNWVYVAKEGHRYRRVGSKWQKEKTEPRGQWGICQDDYGRLFYNYNHSQLHADVVPPNTLTRNPHHTPSTGVSVGVSLTNQVFPIRPTPAANRGYIPGALDEQHRIKEFTSACAPFIYRESLLPEFRDHSFVCEPVGNLIKRSQLTSGSNSVTAASVYPDRDFLASTDERFRPCALTTGPDGALYIADIYRGIVQDAPHMSPYLREHSIARKMDTPVQLGRIWRIVPEDYQDPPKPDLEALDSKELVSLLSHSSGWWRDQAQHLLTQRREASTAPLLLDTLLSSDSELARLHALWTLEGIEQIQPKPLFSLLRDQSTAAPLRAHLLRVLSSINLEVTAWEGELEKLVSTSLPLELALQIVLTLGDLPLNQESKFRFLNEVTLNQAADPLFRDAILSSLTGEALEYLAFLWDQPELHERSQGFAILFESLATAAIKADSALAFEQLDQLVKEESNSWKSAAVIASRQLVTATTTDSADARPLTKDELKLFTRGRQIYLTSCVACHGNDGKGMKLLAPPLAGSDWVTGSEARLVRVLFHGLSGPITVSGKRYEAPEIQPVMPPLANLNNADIAAVLTYIRREWGNAAEPISRAAVTQHRISAQGRTLPWTEEELQPYAETPQIESSYE